MLTLTLNDKRTLSITELPKAYDLTKEKPIVHTIPPSRRPSLKLGQNQANSEGKLAPIRGRYTEQNGREDTQNRDRNAPGAEKRSDIVSHLG